MNRRDKFLQLRAVLQAHDWHADKGERRSIQLAAKKYWHSHINPLVCELGQEGKIFLELYKYFVYCPPLRNNEQLARLIGGSTLEPRAVDLHRSELARIVEWIERLADVDEGWVNDEDTILLKKISVLINTPTAKGAKV